MKIIIGVLFMMLGLLGYLHMKISSLNYQQNKTIQVISDLQDIVKRKHMTSLDDIEFELGDPTTGPQPVLLDKEYDLTVDDFIIETVNQIDPISIILSTGSGPPATVIEMHPGGIIKLDGRVLGTDKEIFEAFKMYSRRINK